MIAAEVSKLPDIRLSSYYINLVHIISLSLFKTFFHINFPYKSGLPNVLFISGFSTKSLQEFLLDSMTATCLAYLILLDFISPYLLLITNHYIQWGILEQTIL